jgi:hypothetical protein
VPAARINDHDTGTAGADRNAWRLNTSGVNARFPRVLRRPYSSTPCAPAVLFYVAAREALSLTLALPDAHQSLPHNFELLSRRRAVMTASPLSSIGIQASQKHRPTPSQAIWSPRSQASHQPSAATLITAPPSPRSTPSKRPVDASGTRGSASDTPSSRVQTH